MDLIYRYDPHQPIRLTSPADADAALAELRQGNRRFAELVARMQARTAGASAGEPLVIPMCPVSLGLPIAPGFAPEQSPFALVMNCSDARVTTEAVFDQSFNALFVVRVAGNVLGTEVLGSIDYAVKNLTSLRVAVVLGHTECGAVTAAVDAYLSLAAYVDIAFTYPLRSLVDRLQIAVRGAARSLEQVYGVAVTARPGYRQAVRDMAVYLNAAVTAYDLAREMAARHGGGLTVAFAVYDIATVRVQADPDAAAGDTRTFAPAPTSSADFVDLGDRWARSAAIASVLG